MGNSVTVEFMGASVKFQSANVEDADKIRGVFQTAGFDKVKQYYESNQEMQEAFDKAGLDFPDEQADVAAWLSDMSPQQGKAVCEAFKG